VARRGRGAGRQPAARGAAGRGGSGGSGGGAGTTGTAGTAAARAAGDRGRRGDQQRLRVDSLSLLNTQGGPGARRLRPHDDDRHRLEDHLGDVVLPSQPQRGGQVVLIDRGNTALDVRQPATCASIGQFSVKGASDGRTRTTSSSSATARRT
jgi:hypothetical protein